jgi:hypothetical protein
MEQAGTVWIIDLITGERSKKLFLEITGSNSKSLIQNPRQFAYAFF